MQQTAEYLAELAVAIKVNHHCIPIHAASIYVCEKNADNETVWVGFVEVFDMPGHPLSNVCYAWLDGQGARARIVTVMGNLLVNSPKRAVQAALFNDVQPADSKILKPLPLLHWHTVEARAILRQTQIKAEDLEAAIQVLKQTRECIRN